MNSETTIRLLKYVQKITPLTEKVLNWVERFPVQNRKVVEKDKERQEEQFCQRKQ